MEKRNVLRFTAILALICFLLPAEILGVSIPIQIGKDGGGVNPPRKAPANNTIPFTVSLESSFITYQSTISYTGVTVEIEDENGVVVESQTLNIVAGTTYTISVTGLDAGEYSIA